MLMKRDGYDPETQGRIENSQHLATTFDARKLWLIARWHIRLVILVTLATVALAAVALTIFPAGYKGTAVVLIDPRQPRVTNAESVISGIGSDAAAVESQVELIESSALASKVIARLRLDKDPEFSSPTIVERALALVGRPWPEERATNELVYRFQRGLSVRRRGLTYVLEITFRSKDAEKAARIANAIAEAYLQDQRAAKSEVTSRASGWFIERIDEMRERVRESDRAVVEFRAKAGLADVTQGNRLINKQIEDLTQQLTLARARSAEARAKLSQAEAAKASGGAALSDVLQSKTIANLRTEHSQASRAVSENALLLGERHPALAAARAQLDAVQRQLDSEIARILTSVRTDNEVASRQESALDRELTRLKDESAEMRKNDVRLAELERDAHVNRTLLEQYLSRAKETDQQQSLQIAEARIISPALVPVKGDRPPFIVLLAAAGVLGLIGAFGLAMLFEQTRGTIRSTEDLKNAVGLSALSIVPSLGRKASYEYLLSHGSSEFAKRIRLVLLRLRNIRLGAKPQILGIASSQPHEGKSTFASNLAIASALAGDRTLLLDADPYNSSIGHFFGTDNSPFKDRGGLFERLSPIAHKSGLHVAHLSSATAREMLERNGLSTFFAACNGTYDRIIVDMPAILPVGTSPTLLEEIEQILFVVEWNSTRRKDVAESLEALQHHSRKVIGAVLNKVPARWDSLAGVPYAEYGANLANRDHDLRGVHVLRGSSPVAQR